MLSMPTAFVLISCPEILGYTLVWVYMVSLAITFSLTPCPITCPTVAISRHTYSCLMQGLRKLLVISLATYILG